MTTGDKDGRNEKNGKKFVSLEQINQHFFPKPVHEKPITDGRKRGKNVADKILEDISTIFR